MNHSADLHQAAGNGQQAEAVHAFTAKLRVSRHSAAAALRPSLPSRKHLRALTECVLSALVRWILSQGVMHKLMVAGRGTRDLCGPSGLSTEEFISAVSDGLNGGDEPQDTAPLSDTGCSHLI